MTPTTKQQARERLTSRDSADVKALIDDVEKAIAKYDGNKICIGARGSADVREAVAEVYRTAGWCVAHGVDQRDGAWMTLA